MKILDLQTHVLSTPLAQPFAFSMGWVDRRSTLIVELTTDAGITGWGEALCHGLQPPQIAAAIVQSALKPLVLGQDPFDVYEWLDSLHLYCRMRPYYFILAAARARVGGVPGRAHS